MTLTGKRFLTLTTLLLMVLFSACEKGPQVKPLTAASTIVAFGDSLTHGTGAPEGQAYPDVLSELLGRPVINAGIPGETTSEGLKRLPEVLETYQPQLVILCEGGNDFLRRHNQKRLFDNLAEMIEKIQATGADVVLVGIPQLGLMVNTHPDYLRLAEAYKIPYEGKIISDLLTERDLKSDTIHPNAAGYRLMAEAIYKVINEAQK